MDVLCRIVIVSVLNSTYISTLFGFFAWNRHVSGSYDLARSGHQSVRGVCKIGLDFSWQACESLHATHTPVAKVWHPFPEASRRFHIVSSISGTAVPPIGLQNRIPDGRRVLIIFLLREHSFRTRFCSRYIPPHAGATGFSDS